MWRLIIKWNHQKVKRKIKFNNSEVKNKKENEKDNNNNSKII